MTAAALGNNISVRVKLSFNIARMSIHSPRFSHHEYCDDHASWKSNSVARRCMQGVVCFWSSLLSFPLIDGSKYFHGIEFLLYKNIFADLGRRILHRRIGCFPHLLFVSPSWRKDPHLLVFFLAANWMATACPNPRDAPLITNNDVVITWWTISI